MARRGAAHFVLGACECIANVIVFAKHRVDQSLIRMQPRHLGRIAGILRGELAQLQHLERFDGLCFLHAHPAEAVEDRGRQGRFVSVLCEVAGEPVSVTRRLESNGITIVVGQ